MNKYVLTEFLELENDSSLLTENERMMNEDGSGLILAGRLQKADAKRWLQRQQVRLMMQCEEVAKEKEILAKNVSL